MFTTLEVIWLCEEMDKRHSERKCQVTTPEAIGRRYCLCVDGLKYWLECYRSGSLEINDCQQCVPPLFDGISMRVLTKALRSVSNNSDVQISKTRRRRRKRQRRNGEELQEGYWDLLM